LTAAAWSARIINHNEEEHRMNRLAVVSLCALGIVFTLVVFFTATGFAQVSTCQIEGKIVDDENKPVPFAAVILNVVKTGVTRGTSTTEKGEFRFDGLDAGKYSLTVGRVGFEQQSRKLELTIGQTTSVSFTLVPRDVETEQLEVPRPGAWAQPGLDAQVLRWYSFDEGIALAQQTNKKVLIDVYTDWCTWCKKMDKDVYTNPDVKAVLQSYFVAVKLNAESPRELSYKGRRLTEMTIAREMGVNGYPTTVFLYSNAEPLTKVAGYIESGDFVKLLRSVTENR
jgi:thiol-disulfide isomerase/thioredoxin